MVEMMRREDVVEVIRRKGNGLPIDIAAVRAKHVRMESNWWPCVLSEYIESGGNLGEGGSNGSILYRGIPGVVNVNFYIHDLYEKNPPGRDQIKFLLTKDKSMVDKLPKDEAMKAINQLYFHITPQQLAENIQALGEGKSIDLSRITLNEPPLGTWGIIPNISALQGISASENRALMCIFRKSIVIVGMIVITDIDIVNPPRANQIFFIEGDYYEAEAPRRVFALPESYLYHMIVKLKFAEPDAPYVPPPENGNGPACPIACVCMGTPLIDQLGPIREFRDKVLKRTHAGLIFVSLYYGKLSPHLSPLLEKSETLRRVGRILVKGLLWMMSK